MRKLLVTIGLLIVASTARADFIASGFFASGFDESGFFETEVAQVAVPDVVGGDLAAADAALEGVGLDTGGVTLTCSTATADEVLSQNPLAGAMAGVGSTVNLVASNGVACRVTSSKIGLKIGIGL